MPGILCFNVDNTRYIYFKSWTFLLAIISFGRQKKRAGAKTCWDLRQRISQPIMETGITHYGNRHVRSLPQNRIKQILSGIHNKSFTLFTEYIHPETLSYNKVVCVQFLISHSAESGTNSTTKEEKKKGTYMYKEKCCFAGWKMSTLLLCKKDTKVCSKSHNTCPIFTISISNVGQPAVACL